MGARLARAKRLGFTHVLFQGPFEALTGKLADLVEAGRQAGLAVWFDVERTQYDLSDPLVQQHAAAFSVRHDLSDGPLDPRHLNAPTGRAFLRVNTDAAAPVLDRMKTQLQDWLAKGVSGLVLHEPEMLRAWGAGFGRDVTIIADMAGYPRDRLAQLSGLGIDYCLSSLAWWDRRSSWIVQEYTALSAIAPVIAPVAPAGGPLSASAEERGRQLQIAATLGCGLLVPGSYVEAPEGDDLALDVAAAAANGLFDGEPALSSCGSLAFRSGSGAPITILRRTERADARVSERAVLTLINTTDAEQAIPPTVWSHAVAPFAPLVGLTTSDSPEAPLAPGEVRLVSLTRTAAHGYAVKSGVPARTGAAAARVIIGGIDPSVDDGLYVVKRVVGDVLTVEADIFGDGHDLLAAELVLEAEGAPSPVRVRMDALPNDLWRASVPLSAMGRHSFHVEAWMDVWGSFARDLGKKRDAGQILTLEVQEGLLLLDAARQRSTGQLARMLDGVKRAAASQATADAVETLLAADLAQAMREADDKPFLARSFKQPVDAERPEAMFASWYELFPRSQTDDPKRHGTLRDVIPRLPAIRDMGFDVLYFTPIHPIGKTNRKGPNNTLTPGPEDVGSPYAIGSAAGGHDALHPELGTFEDFKALRQAAEAHGLELALDFAIQCSPDHPWLKQHHDWFAWRPDGSMKYAENPPKKYQDIVNVDFYGPGAIPDLWNALRDIILFWVRQGVKIFRVDNPHTKPLPFWHWMIGEVRRQHPDVIFLSEAFTRPKVMYHLAKVGFSQSYTYFTWRNTKAELAEYLTELNTTNVRNFFRPQFFVNTPDINPYFLQTSGRPGFLIRAALATTLSGLWGMYSGFELCEHEPLPGKEEYKDSEKFELRPRDWHAPGNIIAEISKLNAIRKAEPALQTHLGFSLYNAFNDQVLYFAKQAPGETGKVLVAISMDPHHPQEASFEVPLWEWGLPDHGAVSVVNLLTDQRFTWHGKTQHVRLTPDAPYAIWKIMPAEGAA